MKSLLIGLCLCTLLAACSGNKVAGTSTTVSPAATTTTLQRSAYTLFETIDREAKASENTFVSPLSVQQAMGLVQAGARGQTATEIEAAFGLAPGDAGVAQLETQRTAIVGESGAVRVKIANALWLARQFSFRQTYLDTTRRRHAAQAERLDFAGDAAGSAGVINAWADRETEGLIKQVVDPASFTDATAAVLTNAVFFEGRWRSEFSEAQAQPFLFGDGSERPFPLMQRISSYRYVESAGWKAVRLPYGEDGRFVMDVLIPRDRSSEARLTARTLSAFGDKLEQAVPELVHVTIPRCEIEWEAKLNASLHALGIKAAFDANSADLTGMADAPPGKLVISSVKQKSKLQIFETGTRAAAVTAVAMMVTGAPANPVRPKEFRADQPFHLVIRDTRSGTILFVGRIATPELYTGGQLP